MIRQWRCRNMCKANPLFLSACSLSAHFHVGHLIGCNSSPPSPTSSHCLTLDQSFWDIFSHYWTWNNTYYLKEELSIIFQFSTCTGELARVWGTLRTSSPRRGPSHGGIHWWYITLPPWWHFFLDMVQWPIGIGHLWFMKGTLVFWGNSQSILPLLEGKWAGISIAGHDSKVIG